MRKVVLVKNRAKMLEHEVWSKIMYLLQKHFDGEDFRVNVIDSNNVEAYFKTMIIYYDDIENFKKDLESIGYELESFDEFWEDNYISVEIRITGGDSDE